MLRGKPILGSHKTWRGLVAGILAGMTVFEAQACLDRFEVWKELALIDYSVAGVFPGFLMGLGAGVGDAVKSFFKRSLGLAPGTTWLVFDQLDFFIGAWLFVAIVFPPPLAPLPAVLPVVFVCDVAATALLYRLGLKESWI